MDENQRRPIFKCILDHNYRLSVGINHVSFFTAVVDVFVGHWDSGQSGTHPEKNSIPVSEILGQKKESWNKANALHIVRG